MAEKPTTAKSSHSEHRRWSYPERGMGSLRAIAGWELFVYRPPKKGRYKFGITTKMKIEQKQCPKCGQFKVISNKGLLFGLGIALFPAGFFTSLILVFFIGPLAFLLMVFAWVLGFFFMLSGTVAAFGRLLPEKYRPKKGFFCSNCNYKWEEK